MFIDNVIKNNVGLQEEKKKDFQNFKKIMETFPNFEDKKTYDTRLLPEIKRAIGQDGILPFIFRGRRIYQQE